jgi:hypothetical protein
MGILSSLFQTGAPVQQVAGPMLGTSKLPEELAPYYKDILGKAQALYNERTAEGFQPYQGPTIADFTPEQQQAFTGISGLVGQQAPVFEEAMDLTRSAAAPMTSEQMTQYMSPYQQAVTDIEKREATKQYESQVVPQLAAQAATTGGFGGSRQAILESMAADTQQRLLSDIQAKGSQQAYQDAVKRFQADRTAAGQAGAQLATMAPNQFKAQLGELGAVQTIGEEKQRQQQTALDEAFRQYQLERNYPYDTMSQYQAVVTGAPVRPTTFAPPPAPTPSIGQQLIGGIGTLGAAYGAFTGNNPLDLLRRKGGGGLSDLPVVYRQTSGLVSFPEAIDPYQRRQGESVQEFGARVQSLKTGDPSIYQNWLRNNKRAGTPDMSGRSGIETAVELAKAAKAEGQGKDTTGVNYFMEDETEFGKGEKPLTAEEIKEKYPDLETIKPIEVTGNTDTGDGGIAALKNRLYPDLSFQYGDEAAINQLRNFDTSGLTDAMADSDKLRLKLQEQDRPTTSSLTKEAEDYAINRQTRLDDYQENEASIMASNAAADKLEREQFYGDREKSLTERESAAGEAFKREQYGNLAMFFARLGSASPKQEGLAGVLGAGLEAAEETLPAALQTSRNYEDKKDMLADRRETLKVSSRNEAVANTREGRKLSKELRKEKYSQTDVIEHNERNELLEASKQDYKNLQQDYQNALTQGATQAELLKIQTDLATAEANLTAVMLEIKGEYNFPNNLDQVDNALKEFQGGDALKDIPNNARAKEMAKAQANVEVQNWIMKNQAYKATTGQIEQMIIERAKELLKDPTLIKDQNRLYKPVEGDQQPNVLNTAESLDDALS